MVFLRESKHQFNFHSNCSYNEPEECCLSFFCTIIVTFLVTAVKTSSASFFRGILLFQTFSVRLCSVIASYQLSISVGNDDTQTTSTGENSNHMLSATSRIELEFLTEFPNMSKLQNRLYQRVPLQNIRQFANRVETEKH